MVDFVGETAKGDDGAASLHGRKTRTLVHYFRNTVYIINLNANNFHLRSFALLHTVGMMRQSTSCARRCPWETHGACTICLQRTKNWARIYIEMIMILILDKATRFHYAAVTTSRKVSE
jgi:hypothetical protein